MSPTPSRVAQLRGHLSRALFPVLGRSVAAVLHNRVRMRDCVIDTASPYITPATVARLFLGRYEAPEIDFIRHWLPTDLDVVELGASIGVGTAHIARRLPRDRQLICVEANPHLIPLIHDNVQRNAPGRPVVVLNQAIDYSGRSSVQLQFHESNLDSRLGGGAGSVAVAATTLSALVARFGLGAFTLIADIEGAELGLILQDAAALRQVRYLMIELHATEQAGEQWTPERLRDLLLTRHDFQLHAAYRRVHVFDRSAAPA